MVGDSNFLPGGVEKGNASEEGLRSGIKKKPEPVRSQALCAVNWWVSAWANWNGIGHEHRCMFPSQDLSAVSFLI